MSEHSRDNQASEPHFIRGRRAARFAAVQALYQLEQDENLTPDLVLLQFTEHRLSRKGVKEDLDGFRLDNPNKAFFAQILSGAQTQAKEIDDIIVGLLPDNWSLARIDSVLRAILRAGTYELAYLEDVPARVAINEYVEVAKSFFNAREPGLVNGLLDTVAQTMRPDEIAT